MDITIQIPAETIVYIGDIAVMLKAPTMVSLNPAFAEVVAKHLTDRLPMLIADDTSIPPA